MPTRLVSVVIDAADPPSLARFWSAATGWPVAFEDAEEVDVEPPEGVPGTALSFVWVDDPKSVKNRVHLDLDSRSTDEQQRLADRLRGLGATDIDIGQRGKPWIVLADPEGNELCVLDPRDEYRDRGAIAAIVMDVLDPDAVAGFWAAATGRTAERYPDGDVRLPHPEGMGPHLELLRSTDPKVVKNRLHLDVAPFAGDDHAAEVDRLRALGATDVDIGQGDETWTVLADPEGSELCVLSPRD